MRVAPPIALAQPADESEDEFCNRQWSKAELLLMEKAPPEWRTWFQKPFHDAIDWCEILKNTLGERFLMFVIVTFFGLRGLVHTLSNAVMMPMFKAMNADGNTFQLVFMVSQIPWAMKGWMGVLSDCFPISGYHKRHYLVISSGLGLIGIIGVLLSQQLGYGVWVGAGLFCFINIKISTFDLFCKAKYTELLKGSACASKVVSFVRSSLSFGMLITSVLVLVLMDSLGFRALLSFTVPFAVIALGMALRGDLPEARLRPSKGGVQWVKLQSEPKMFALAAFVAVGAVLMAASVVAFRGELRMVMVLCVSIGLVVLAYLALPRTLANGNLYMLLVFIAYLDLSGPLGYYYTANSRCVANGPGFSNGYYLAATSILGAVGGFIGSLFFQRMQAWTFRQAFLLTTCVRTGASLFDWMIVKRLNVAMGISDEAMFLFGTAACQIAIMLAKMPCALLTSLLCPRGAEATVCAILAGFENFGEAVASVLGVWLTRHLQIHAGVDGHPGECDFTNLSTAILIARCALPMLCLPAAWVLVPNVRMSDETAFEQLVSPAPSSPDALSESGDSSSAESEVQAMLCFCGNVRRESPRRDRTDRS